MKRITIALLSCLAVACSDADKPESAPLSASEAVAEQTLDNGLKIIVREDHRAPVVVSQVWYKVGSSYEPSGITGVSHVLEHMMFKGTAKHGPGEFNRIVAAAGGRDNAFTGLDYTAYFQTLSADKLAVSFELEADRMRNLALAEELFNKERNVVIEERRLRTEDRPTARLYEQLMATAFTSHPYRHPIIGWMNDLENLELSDLQAWYERWYTPNNATLVVVGDVDAEDVFALAADYFGDIPQRPVLPLKPQVEPPQKGKKQVVVEAPAQVPHLILGYHTPGLTSGEESDAYALAVLAGVLSGGNSARLMRDLIRGQEIASTASAEYNPLSRAPGLFLLDGAPANAKGIDDLRAALLAQIDRLKTEPVSAVELERVKTQVVAAEIYSRDSVFYQAMRIGMTETNGLDWRLLDEYVDKIQAVTAAQVTAVAQRYLVESNLTEGILKPLPISAPTPAAQGQSTDA